MLKIEKFVTPSTEQWEIIIEGMRNPKNSWDRMDSGIGCNSEFEGVELCKKCESRGSCFGGEYVLGPNDHQLMMSLAKGGPVHAKYRRMIPVWVTLTAPLYWWKEFDTYKVGTVANSCSTMHKIHAKEFTLEDFSCEHLDQDNYILLRNVIARLNTYRDIFNNGGVVEFPDAGRKEYKPNDKDIWWQMIQLLPTSYNQKRTVMLSYENLANIYKWRRNHKLDEWHVFCDWIEELPYSELIVGDLDEKKED